MKILFYDIETYKEFFLFVGYDMFENKWYEFRINRYQNDLYRFLKFRESKKDYHWTGFNNISFDSQVVEYIIRNHEDWAEIPKLEMCSIIYDVAGDAIQRSNYRLPLRYWEETLSHFQIDLFKIHHFDGEQKRTSLKWLEFMMEMDNVETTPIDPGKVDLTEEDIEAVVKYCYNDVNAVRQLWLYTIGEVDNEEYKGKNMIQNRLDVIKEFGFPSRAISWNNVKIGDEINLSGYMKRTGKTRKDIYAAKKARKTVKMTFGDCIPDYVTFTTKEFNDFYDKIKDEKIRFFDKKQKFIFTYGKTSYLIAKGGIHSIDKRRRLVPRNFEILEDADVGSQYPNAINKRKLYPRHLGKEWLINYEYSISQKDKFKKLGKQGDSFAKGVEAMYKEALNGGGFGKTNEVNSWQYGPEVTFACTIGNQFEVLMLIEKMETTGIRVVSANTDGIVCLYPEHLKEQYKKNCAWWEDSVGNKEMGKLEYTQFKKLYQTTVNDYIAIKSDGKVKKKGDFLTDHLLNKNKNRKIVPIALEKYVLEGIPVEKTIREHKKIHDFLIGVKAGKDYHYEAIDREGNSEIYHRLVVYYVSNDGRKLLKIKNEDSDATGNDVTQCEAPDKDDDRVWLCTVANQVDSKQPIKNFNIDYEYYIRKAKRIIESVEGKLPPPEQISLF